MRQVAGMLSQLLTHFAPESPQITFLQNGLLKSGPSQAGMHRPQLQLPAPAPHAQPTNRQLALPAPTLQGQDGGHQQHGPAPAPQTEAASQPATQQAATPAPGFQSSPNGPEIDNKAGSTACFEIAPFFHMFVVWWSALKKSMLVLRFQTFDSSTF